MKPEAVSAIVNRTETYASVMEVHGPCIHAVAQANVFIEEGVWWIARVKVHESLQGKGVGSRILNRLVDEVRAAGAKAIVVSPGGYNSDPVRQANFYVKNGFVQVEGGLYRRELQ